MQRLHAMRDQVRGRGLYGLGGLGLIGTTMALIAIGAWGMPKAEWLAPDCAGQHFVEIDEEEIDDIVTGDEEEYEEPEEEESSTDDWWEDYIEEELDETDPYEEVMEDICDVYLDMVPDDFWEESDEEDYSDDDEVDPGYVEEEEE